MERGKIRIQEDSFHIARVKAGCVELGWAGSRWVVMAGQTCQSFARLRVRLVVWHCSTYFYDRIGPMLVPPRDGAVREDGRDDMAV